VPLQVMPAGTRSSKRSFIVRLGGPHRRAGDSARNGWRYQRATDVHDPGSPRPRIRLPERGSSQRASAPAGGRRKRSGLRAIAPPAEPPNVPCKRVGWRRGRSAGKARAPECGTASGAAGPRRSSAEPAACPRRAPVALPQGGGSSRGARVHPRHGFPAGKSREGGVSSHRRLIVLSRLPRTLRVMRRFVLIGTGAAAAAVFLLPAAAAWLRQPVAQPLPEPVRLQGLPEAQKPDIRRSSRRERSSPLSRSRSARRTVRQGHRPAAAGARHAVLAPVVAGRSSRFTPSPSSGASPTRASVRDEDYDDSDDDAESSDSDDD
jgi:hypothetical protein